MRKKTETTYRLIDIENGTELIVYEEKRESIVHLARWRVTWKQA
jgi:hypothetical protein